MTIRFSKIVVYIVQSIILKNLLLFLSFSFSSIYFYCAGVVGISGGFFIPGQGDFAYSDMECTGNENRLVDCELDETGFTCSHFQDAGVICPGIHERGKGS